MPHKIEFTVVFASGEEDRHRATELNAHGPTVRGWQSSRNCSYPQELVFQLHHIATVQRIQVLAHQYLIPEKLELWSSNPRADECDVTVEQFEYLGFITLSDNQSTGFKSRELKSVTVPSCTAKYLKLRLHENHKNSLNVYNQVGLIALNVLGQPLESPCPSPSEHDKPPPEANINGDGPEPKGALPLVGVQNGNNNPLLLVNNPQYTSPYDDLAFEMYVDPEVARIIRAMEVKKQQAVICERFEFARKLKLAMEDLRVAGERLSKYELEKRQAIHLEDYDRAKHKKAQMEEYRNMVYRFLEVDNLLEINGPLEKNDECLEACVPGSKRPELPPPPRLLQVPQGGPVAPGREGAVSPSHAPPAMHQSPVSPLHHHNRPKSPPGVQGSSPNSKISPNTSPTNQQQVTVNLRGSLRRRNKSAVQTQARTSYEAYEERTVPVPQTVERPLGKVVSATGYEPKGPGCHNNSLRDYQLDSEVSTRSKLSERERKQAVLPISVFGDEIIFERLPTPQLMEKYRKKGLIPQVEKFYSKQYSDKEEGLRMLKEELRKHVTGDIPPEQQQQVPNKIARAAIFLLHRALRDKVYSVYSLAAETIRIFFVEFVPARVTPAEVTRSVERLLPELLSKSGDTTPRIHNMAVHTILSMADCQEVRELHIIPVHLSRPLTSSTHPRLALSRLEMVEQLILNHGISTDKQRNTAKLASFLVLYVTLPVALLSTKGVFPHPVVCRGLLPGGLTCRVLAELGSSGLHHSAEAVRKVAERILTLVYKVNPRLVRKQLPPDDDITRRNLLYRQLFHEFDKIDIQDVHLLLDESRKFHRGRSQRPLLEVVPYVDKVCPLQTGRRDIQPFSPSHW
uniref:Centrosomal protein CEP104 N-terminal domain-containing protein n=1 Tax=Timema monikensis TaxID=170555 RepID=A0A7R9HI80_9NEOP|nr:unnamed protein product [Timema monikensis]